MTSKIYNVTDLGTGDGGKGGVVHAVSTKTRAHTIIKRGGAQGSHGVITSTGYRFAFSQWGCGTIEGIRTHISPQMVISPTGLLNEAESLRYECGIHNAFDLLTVDQRALCATPYHRIASRLKELARGDNPRGTIGTGVGEAYRQMERFPELAIWAGDLSQSNLKDRLADIRKQLFEDLAVIIHGDFLLEDRKTAEEEIELLKDDTFLVHITSRFQEASRRAKIVDPEFLGREILSRDGVVVVESSHGVLTDHFHGFNPHTSAIRTLPCFTQTMLRDAGYAGQIVNLGVTRAYAIRHGAGPLPTDNPKMAETLLPGSTREEDRYRGKVRVGPIDFVLLRYAIEVCGGPTAFDGLAVTWFDQVQSNKAWHTCSHYKNAVDQKFFSPSGEILVNRMTDVEQLASQERLGKALQSCIPEIVENQASSSTRREEQFSFCADVVSRELGVPVRLVSFGPTELNKFYK